MVKREQDPLFLILPTVKDKLLYAKRSVEIKFERADELMTYFRAFFNNKLIYSQ